MKFSTSHLGLLATQRSASAVAQTGSLLYRRLAVGRPASNPETVTCPSRRTSCIPSAFTIIEMMVTVGLLGFIVMGLTAMFVHTQRAFRAGVTQTDVLEAGRATVDILTRDLEAITPSRLPNVTNFFTRYEGQSFNTLPPTPATQARTNVLTCFFGLVQNNRQWSGVGYVVALPANTITAINVGTLYRFEYAMPSTNTLRNVGGLYTTAALTAIKNLVATSYYPPNTNIQINLTRVCDGVIGLRVLAYNEDGLLISPTNTIKNIVANVIPTSGRVDFPVSPNTNGIPSTYEYTFTNNAVPAYVDLELSILESRTYDRFKGIPNTAAQSSYLQNQIGAVHVFRRRVAIHNVAVEAYQ